MADLRQRVLPNRLRSNSLIGLVVTIESNHFIILKYCCLFQHFVISCSTYEEPRPIRVALFMGRITNFQCFSHFVLLLIF